MADVMPRKRRTVEESGTVTKVKHQGVLWWRGTYHHRPKDENDEPLLNTQGKPVRNRRYVWIAPADRKDARYKSEQDAQKEIWRISSIENGRVATRHENTIADMLDIFNDMRRSRREKATISSAAGTTEMIRKSYIGQLPIQTITSKQLNVFLESLVTRQCDFKTVKRQRDGTLKTYKSQTRRTGSSLSLIQKVITQLRNAFKVAMEMRLITVNPADSALYPLEVPKGVRKPVRGVLPWPDYHALLKGLEADGKRQNALILELAMMTGPRPNELFALKAKDVQENIIVVERAFDRDRVEKDTKTEKDRVLVLGDELEMKVNAWVLERKLQPEDYLFTNGLGGPISRSVFLKRHLRKAAIKTKIKTTGLDFRMFRRTFSTRCNDAKVNPKATQAQMGHENLGMTAITYMQTPEREIMRQEMNKLYQYSKEHDPAYQKTLGARIQ